MLSCSANTEQNAVSAKISNGMGIVLAAAIASVAVILHPFLGVYAAISKASVTGCAKTANVTEIAPGAFVRQGVISLPDATNRGGIANIGFILGDSSVAVIDTGGSYCDGLGLLLAIRAKTGLPVRYVINTHVHPDHSFGNAAFLHEGANIIGHRNLPRSLSERGEHYLRSYTDQAGEAAMDGTKIVPPGLIVEDRMVIDLGGRELTLTAHPAAHTDNDLTVFDEESGILWTGDLIFLDHVPVLDGSLRGWLSVTYELMAHKASRIVPGHGPALAPWPESGHNQMRYLQRLAGDLRAAIHAGSAIGQAASEAARRESGKWRLFESFNNRNATAGFAELEWE